MEWEVEYTDEFGDWWATLNEAEQEDTTAVVELLEQKGPQLPFPHSSGISNSKHSHMHELRIQHAGRPYRTLFAFDPQGMAILLIGGNKTGNNRWYDENIPLADKLYGEHIKILNKEAKQEKAMVMKAQLPLAELRQARYFSQEQLAAVLDVKQPAIAKFEKKTDMYISSLRRFIEAMGGQLEINAHFPEGDVKINQFEEIDEEQMPAT